MRSTTHNEENPSQERRGWSKVLKDVFGGEFLLSRQMRRWYPYVAFVLVLMAVMVVSEQRIQEKKKKIAKLENQYKAELSRLKANNQFIPYEESKALIETLKSRGFDFDESSDYTVTITTPKEEKFAWLKKIFKRDKKKDAEKKSK